MKLKVQIVAISLLCLTASGCDSGRLGQFGTFAAEGSLYVSTFHTFTVEAGSAMIASDSATLITARNLAGPLVSKDAAAYSRQLVAEDQELETYLRNLRRIDDQAALLGAYFTALTQFADGKNGSSGLASADALLDSINGLSDAVGGTKFSGKSVKDYLDPITSTVVVHVQVRVLDRQLQRAAPILDRALALQAAAAEAITAQLQEATRSALRQRESADVIDPYVAAAALPAGWAANREALLRTEAILEDAQNATAAANALHQAFRTLLRGQDAIADLRQLTDAVNRMAGFTAALNPQPAGAR